MSDSEGNPDPLSDWMVMVKGAGEAADADSESTDSSIEVVSFQGQDAVSFRCRLDEISSQTDKDEEESKPALLEGEQVVETDGGLGACCMELVMMSAAEKSGDEQLRPTEEVPMSVHGDEPSISAISSDPVGDNQSVKDDSGDESDFICLNVDENVEELSPDNVGNNEALPRVVLMERSTSSIGPSFNFFRQEEPVRHRDDDDDQSDIDSMADLDDETESSVEDAVDDRIESEQSEVGSIQAQNDVGDLSAFADIGDLPLEVGNVARNYIHRPNNRLSTLLNATVVLAAILTMGISLGIIMAGDLEIEEWQRAYDGQLKKTLEIEDRLFKAELNYASFDEVLNTFVSAQKLGEPVTTFLTSLETVVSDYKKCKEAHRYLPSHDCQLVVLANIQQSVLGLKPSSQKKKEVLFSKSFHDVDRSSGSDHRILPETHATENGRVGVNEDIPKGIPLSDVPELNMKQLQQSITREQERALRWQQLYLYERRQRERERDNEELEDQRDRALWEKEDEEEDRELRKQWEKEEEEEDRKERLRWEQEEAEEDKRDRERWEREKARVTFEECFKVVSANLTGMAQNVLKWNTTRLQDFANLSMLMSSVAELKESVVQSVKQLRKSTETAYTGTGKAEKKNNENSEEVLFKQKSVSEYLQRALKSLKFEINNILSFKDDENQAYEPENETQPKSHSQNGGDDYHSRGDDNESDHGKWRKAFKNLVKMTSKSLRRFGKEIAHTWKNVKSAFKSKKAQHQDVEKETQFKAFSPELVKNVCKGLYLPDQVFKGGNNIGSVAVDVGCKCAQNVRYTWYKNVLSKPCEVLGIYSYACNIDYIMLEQEISQLLNSVETLIKKDNVKPSLISSFGYKARKRRLEELQDFWDTWGDHEFLMKSDREWARCRLKWWSDVLNGGNLYNDDSCRSVNLIALFEGLVEKEAQRTFIKKSMDESEPPSSNQEDVRVDEIEDDTNVNVDKEVYEEKTSGESSKDMFIEDHEDVDKINFSYDDDDYDDDDKDEEEEGEKDGKPFVYDHFVLGTLDHVKIEDAANDTFDDTASAVIHHDEDITEDDENEFSERDWLLERAQHRLQLRRDKEKASWSSERAAQRGKLRQMNRETSPEWSLEKARLREALRKKEHEADWFFNRAKHRREKHVEKWAKYPSDKERKKAHKTQDFKRSPSFDEESPHSGFNRRQDPQRGQKWQKKWKKGNNKHKHSHSGDSKKQRQHCKKGKQCRGGKREKFGGQIKRFVRQVFAAISNP